jgi:Ca2+-binding RTX toxin-like protein
MITATDADGDSVTYTLRSGPAGGTVTFTDGAGGFVYQAGSNLGTDSFVVEVSDGHGGITTQTVTVDVTNTGPVIGSGSTTFTTVMHGQSVTGSIVAFDADGDTLTYSLLSGPNNGTVSLTGANGGFVYTAGTLAGVDTFSLMVSDGYGGTSVQNVSVGVTGVLDLSGATAATAVNVGAGTAVNAPVDLLKWTIDVNGSAFADIIYGDARNNVLRSGDGKDDVHGAAGHDTIEGGLGDDKLFGEDGNDYLVGGDGVDILHGGAHNDTMHGGVGNDGLFGGGAADLIFGGDGNDRVFGDGGHDTIYGGAGNDTLTGGTTNGTGEQGNDTFVWERADVVRPDGASVGFDRVTDFGAGDRLDFSRMFGSTPVLARSVVQLADTTAGTVVSAAVGVDGAFVDVVLLDNVHGFTVDDLLLNNQLVV